MKKYIAEFIGTATLVLFGTGIAVVSGGNLIATASNDETIRLWDNTM